MHHTIQTYILQPLLLLAASVVALSFGTMALDLDALYLAIGIFAIPAILSVSVVHEIYEETSYQHRRAVWEKGNRNASR